MLGAISSRAAPLSVAARPARHPLRVLVVDDNHINRIVTPRLIENMGHLADVVRDGKAAVQAFELIAYDVVLMDLQMPEMDGYEASRQIRLLKRQAGRRAPVIAITAHTRKENREKCLAWGFDDYVPKPILRFELKAAIDRTTTETESIGRSPAPAQADGQGDVIDMIAALARVEGDQELLGAIARMFLAQYPLLLAEIDRTLSATQCAARADAAHTLGSSAGQIGATCALRMARRIEDCAERRALANVPATLAALKAEIALVESALVELGFGAPL